MPVTVRVPAPLRTHTGGAAELHLDGNDVAAVLQGLDAQYPGLRKLLLDERGVRRFVNLYVGEHDIRSLDGLATSLRDGDELIIIAAVAGG